MSENESTIYQWARETFGAPRSNLQIALRAGEELQELMAVLVEDDQDPKAVEEVADVVIVLSQIVAGMGGNLQAAIDRKMAINRARQWRTDGQGVGQHIEASVARVDVEGVGA